MIPAGQARGWVAPFGDPGISDCAHLPRAFRSVLRPSSPLSAKASTRCPSLSHPIQSRRSQRHAPASAGAPQDGQLRMDLLDRTPLVNADGGAPRGHVTSLFTASNSHTLPAPPGGGDRVRTGALLLAKQALSRLSYTPSPDQKTEGRTQPLCLLRSAFRRLLSRVGQGGFEPPTSRLSSARSNRLSY
jgi:hypothetical protein